MKKIINAKNWVKIFFNFMLGKHLRGNQFKTICSSREEIWGICLRKITQENEKKNEAPQSWYLYGGTEEEEGQVEDREARQQVLLRGHGSSVVFMLTVHHHHVDHQTHHRHTKHQTQQEGALPPRRRRREGTDLFKSSHNKCFLLKY